MRPASGLYGMAMAIGTIFLLGSSVWLIKTVRYQSALSGMYIAKSHCDYSSKKAVIVFLDDKSVKALREFRATIDGILKEADKTFADAGIEIRYDVKKLKLRSWNTDSDKCKFYDAKFADEKWCFVNEMNPAAGSSRKIYDPDVLIFITASGVGNISGKSFWKIEQGNGTIVLNLGSTLTDYGTSEKLKASAKRFYQKKFGQLLAHEQAHLYGVPHSPKQFSIMNESLDALGGHRAELDGNSVRILRERNSRLEEAKKSCAAEK